MSDTIKSPNDARVANSPVRHAPRVLSEAGKRRMSTIKDLGEAFLSGIAPDQGREFIRARTRGEEAIMCAGKGRTR